MKIALWSASALVAFAMLSAGSLKIFVPRSRLVRWMKWARTWSDGRVKLLGVVEVLGGLGLILPALTGVWPILTPLAALGIVLLMCGAAKTHQDLGEPVALPVAVGLLGGAIAAARFAGIAAP